MKQPEQKERPLPERIWQIGQELSALSSGDLAQLRRGPLREGEAGAPAFWRLALAEGYGFRPDEKWATIIQAMALLTHRKPDGKGHVSPHNDKNHLGKALCDGGDDNWKSGLEARPVLSELRFARLLNSHGKTRRDLLLRAIRMLRRSGSAVNCADIAFFILEINDNHSARRIAQSYYQRLDVAAGQSARNAQ